MQGTFVIDRPVFDERAETRLRLVAREIGQPVSTLTEPLIVELSYQVEEAIGELLTALGSSIRVSQDIEYPAACRIELVGPDIMIEGESMREFVGVAIEAILQDVRATCYALKV